MPLLPGGTQKLPRLVGPAIAKELMFTGRVIDGMEAARIGLVNHCVEQDDSKEAAYKRALDLAREISSQVNPLIKSVLNEKWSCLRFTFRALE